jgi:hypothetical protein
MKVIRISEEKLNRRKAAQKLYEAICDSVDAYGGIDVVEAIEMTDEEYQSLIRAQNFIVQRERHPLTELVRLSRKPEPRRNPYMEKV